MHVRLGILCAAAVATTAGAAIAATNTGVTSLEVAKRTVAGKSETIVVDNRGVTVYELGGESLKKLECITKACFAVWPPVEVKSATAKPTLGTGVPGTVSLIHRVKGGFYQVMLDRHPLYYYSGDAGRKGKVTGQGITSFGGTWHVVPAAKPPASSP